MTTKSSNKITAICVLCILVSVAVFMIIYFNNKSGEFEYKKHLDEQVVSISSAAPESTKVSIDMQEMAYYIINVEGDINDMAYQYNSSSPGKFWNLKVKTTYTMRDYAKDLAMDSCVRDNIYYMEALRNGIELTEEEDKMASEDAYAIIKNLTGRQMDISDFTYEVLYSIEKKLFLASKYAKSLTQDGYETTELELEGSYYNELLSEYDVTVNEEIWDKVELGNLSIE